MVRKRNKSCRLDEIGIKPGDKLQFVPAVGVYTDIFVTVIDNQNIEYNGEIMSRAQFNKRYNTYQRQDTKTNEQQSTRYLYYKGNSIADIWKTYCETNNILEHKEKNIITPKKKSGYVYILTNPSFKENIFKCGNSNDYKKRMKKLYTTGIPTPFEAVAVIWVPNCEEVENFFHAWMSKSSKIKRITNNREFFEGDIEEVKTILHSLINTLFHDSGRIEI